MASLHLAFLFCGFALFIGLADGETMFVESKGNSTNGEERGGKYLSLFSVVRFSHSSCTASSGYNGTCQTSAECNAVGGTGTGSCASGFGVCCVFTYTTCGSTSNRNCTYWQNPGGGTYNQIGQCNFIVKKCSSNICQIRLDFYSFTLNQPDVNGVCSVDMFTVSSGASNPIPVICGDNTGQHMYLDMTPSTDSFQLSVTTTTANMSRSWSIKATQISCADYSLLAPAQCLQYYQEFYGTIQSFNYKPVSLSTSATTTRQLADQDYAICIRANAGFCGVRYTACTDSLNSPYGASFSVSGAQDPATLNPTVVDSSCTTDWLMIPCANNQRIKQPSQDTSPPTTPTSCVSRICGGVFSSYTTGGSLGVAATAPVPVYSYRKPFVLNYYTDSMETANTDSNNLGFCLNYVQQICPNKAANHQTLHYNLLVICLMVSSLLKWWTDTTQ